MSATDQVQPSESIGQFAWGAARMAAHLSAFPVLTWASKKILGSFIQVAETAVKAKQCAVHSLSFLNKDVESFITIDKVAASSTSLSIIDKVSASAYRCQGAFMHAQLWANAYHSYRVHDSASAITNIAISGALAGYGYLDIRWWVLPSILLLPTAATIGIAVYQYFRPNKDEAT